MYGRRVTAASRERSLARSLPSPQIPPGHVWLEGDNPHSSLDSRSYGPLPAARVHGRVTARVWPLSEARWLCGGIDAVARPTHNATLLRKMRADPALVAHAARAAAAIAEAEAAEARVYAAFVLAMEESTSAAEARLPPLAAAAMTTAAETRGMDSEAPAGMDAVAGTFSGIDVVSGTRAAGAPPEASAHETETVEPAVTSTPPSAEVDLGRIPDAQDALLAEKKDAALCGAAQKLFQRGDPVFHHQQQLGQRTPGAVDPSVHDADIADAYTGQAPDAPLPQPADAAAQPDRSPPHHWDAYSSCGERISLDRLA